MTRVGRLALLVLAITLGGCAAGGGDRVAGAANPRAGTLAEDVTVPATAQLVGMGVRGRFVASAPGVIYLADRGLDRERVVNVWPIQAGQVFRHEGVAHDEWGEARRLSRPRVYFDAIRLPYTVVHPAPAPDEPGQEVWPVLPEPVQEPEALQPEGEGQGQEGVEG